MGNFLKNCPACSKEFTDLVEYMNHIKTEHKDVPPQELLDMGKEHKWNFRS